MGGLGPRHGPPESRGGDVALFLKFSSDSRPTDDDTVVVSPRDNDTVVSMLEGGVVLGPGNLRLRLPLDRGGRPPLTKDRRRTSRVEGLVYRLLWKSTPPVYRVDRNIVDRVP